MDTIYCKYHEPVTLSTERHFLKPGFLGSIQIGKILCLCAFVCPVKRTFILTGALCLPCLPNGMTLNLNSIGMQVIAYFTGVPDIVLPDESPFQG